MNRNNNFNIVRWIALTMVLYGHQFDLLKLNAPVFLGMVIHGVGVRILFVISGYLVCKSYQREKNAAKYFFKRVMRIFPLLIFVILMIVCISSAFTSINIGDYFKYSGSYILHNLLLSPKFDLPGVFVNNYYPVVVNGSLWTLPIEFVCYFITPVMCFICKRGKTRKIWISVGSLGLIGGALMELGVISRQFVFWGTDWIGAWRLMVYFLIGAIVAVAKVEKYFNMQIAFLLLVVLNCMSSRYIVLFLPVAVSYIFLSFALCEKPLFYKCMSKIECSYGMYLWGFFVQQCLIDIIFIRLQKNMNVNFLFILSFIITYIFSVITFYIVEKPVGKWINHVLIKRNAADEGERRLLS